MGDFWSKDPKNAPAPQKGHTVLREKGGGGFGDFLGEMAVTPGCDVGPCGNAAISLFPETSGPTKPIFHWAGYIVGTLPGTLGRAWAWYFCGLRLDLSFNSLNSTLQHSLGGIRISHMFVLLHAPLCSAFRGFRGVGIW